MKKNNALKILNAILALLILTQILSGYLAMQLPRKVFEVVHKGGAVVLLLCVLLHVTLNWTWIKTSYFKPKRTA